MSRRPGDLTYPPPHELPRWSSNNHKLRPFSSGTHPNTLLHLRHVTQKWHWWGWRAQSRMVCRRAWIPSLIDIGPRLRGYQQWWWRWPARPARNGSAWPPWTEGWYAGVTPCLQPVLWADHLNRWCDPLQEQGSYPNFVTQWCPECSTCGPPRHIYDDLTPRIFHLLPSSWGPHLATQENCDHYHWIAPSQPAMPPVPPIPLVYPFQAVCVDFFVYRGVHYLVVMDCFTWNGQ